jgi:hypothetical protein
LVFIQVQHVTVVLKDDRYQCLVMPLTWHLENGGTSTSIRLCVEAWHEECGQLLAWDGDAERREGCKEEEPCRAGCLRVESDGDAFPPEALELMSV